MDAMYNPWISSALIAAAAYYIAKKMPERLQMLPEQIRSPQMFALVAGASALGVQKFYMRRSIGTPVDAVSEVVAPIVNAVSPSPMYPPRGLLGAEQFYGN